MSRLGQISAKFVVAATHRPQIIQFFLSSGWGERSMADQRAGLHVGAFFLVSILAVRSPAMDIPWYVASLPATPLTASGEFAAAPVRTFQVLQNEPVGQIVPQPPKMEYIALDRSGHPVNGIPDNYQPNYKTGYDNGYVVGYDAGLL